MEAACVVFIVSCAQAQVCTVSNASGSYGNVDVLAGAAVDTTSSFSVTCTGNKNKTVRLCIEMGAGSPIGRRQTCAEQRHPISRS